MVKDDDDDYDEKRSNRDTYLPRNCTLNIFDSQN